MRAPFIDHARKGAAAFAVGVMALGSVSLTALALADENDTPADQTAGQAQADAALVRQLKAGDNAKLTIHKLKGGFDGENTYGTEQTVDGTALDGIAFDIYQIKGIDLSTIEGWQEYAKLDPKKANDYATQANYVKTLTTAGGGIASDTLPIGVYVVRENLAKSTATDRANLVPSAPFITALPFTTEDGSAWNKDVHVYPKNQEIKGTKTVQDQSKQAQQEIVYTLGGDVPPIPTNVTGEYFDNYELIDIYQSAKWTPNTESVTLKATGGDQDLAFEAADFTVSGPDAYTQDAATGYIAKGDTSFNITLTEAGLRKLEGYVRANSNVRVVATVSGKLAQGLQPGDLVNEMQVIPPNIAQPGTKSKPTPPVEVVSKYGKITITKVNAKDETVKLAGATFQLYKCTNANTAGQPGTLLEGAKPLTVDGVEKWITGEDGTFSITGVQLEDFYDGETQTDEFDYCLVETKAPQGFELLPQPILVPVNQSTPVVEAEGGWTLSTTISNVPSTPKTFKLPMTGEAGRWWLVGGGAAALLAAAGMLAANRRRSEAN